MSNLKLVGWVLGIGVLFVVGAYALWAAFIPMKIGQKAAEREVIKQSPQYADTKKSAALKLYQNYTDASGAHREAIKMRMCEEAADAPSGAIPKKINLVCNN